MPPTTVSVKILDKEYQVACQPEEIDDLAASARHLDKQMRTIREAGRVLGLDRVAVMAALNVTHDLLKMKGAEATTTKDSDRRVSEMLSRVSRAIADCR